MLEDIKNIKSGKKELREFGLTIGVILVILGALALWRQRSTYPYLLIMGAIFVMLGLIKSGILKPLQKIWMGVAVVVGFFVSRIILFILFYAVLTPSGIITRILGKDILDQKIDKNCASYWKEASGQTKDRKSYENQY